MTASQQKQELRNLYRQKRLALSPKNHQKFSTTICQSLSQILIPFQPQIIAAYWPIQGEVNITSLFTKWHEKGWIVCLPSLGQDQKSSLIFRTWSPSITLQPNQFQIPEPPIDASQHTPSILCIPCLAFDQQGYRLGYGKGYYDQYIKTNPSCLKIGIAFSCQEHLLLPHEPHDHPLNLIITEREIIKLS